MKKAKRLEVETRDVALFQEKLLQYVSRRIGRRGPAFNYDGLAGEVKTSEVQSIFCWIVEQTKGFTIPVRVNFWGNKATLVGMCLASIGVDICNQLLSLSRGMRNIPSFTAGWHNSSCLSPYLMFYFPDNTAPRVRPWSNRQRRTPPKLTVINVFSGGTGRVKNIEFSQIVAMSHEL